MADIINLRQVRKAWQKAEAAAHAGVNRAKHGRTLSQRTATEAEAERLRRTLDGAALEDSPGDGKPRE